MEQVIYDPDNYNKEWFEGLTRFDKHNETAFYAVLALLGKPSSLLDVGCGTGYVVDLAGDMGIISRGVELDTYVGQSSNVYFHDLRYPVDLHQTFDMVLCWEVAEHLPEDSADVLCDTLARHTEDWLVFTAAHENQGGNWHVNEKNQAYWINKLEARGLQYREIESIRLSILWFYTTGPMHWFPENVMVFKKRVEDES